MSSVVNASVIAFKRPNSLPILQRNLKKSTSDSKAESLARVTLSCHHESMAGNARAEGLSAGSSVAEAA